MKVILDNRATDTGLDVLPDEPSASGGAMPERPDRWSRSRPLFRVPTSRFGILEVEPDLVVEIVGGLIGFDLFRQFVVVRHSDSSAFRWLQSLDEPTLAFPVLEPNGFRPDYAPTISDADAAQLELTPETEALVFTIVTVPHRNSGAMTANLMGPIVINAATRKGKQVIVQDEGFTTRHNVVEELERTVALQRSTMISVMAETSDCAVNGQAA